MSRELSAASIHCLPNSPQESAVGMELLALNSVDLALPELGVRDCLMLARSCEAGSSGVEEAFGVPLKGRGVAAMDTGVAGLSLG